MKIKVTLPDDAVELLQMACGCVEEYALEAYVEAYQGACRRAGYSDEYDRAIREVRRQAAEQYHLLTLRSAGVEP